MSKVKKRILVGVSKERIKKTEIETAALWYENMTLEAKINDETADLWYEIMTGGM